jgi:hypothetical protein
MRFGIIAAVALTAASAICSASAAQAQEWCGYAVNGKSVIECGYTTAAECESAVGKGGMCFVDPDSALLIDRRALQGVTHRLSAG